METSNGFVQAHCEDAVGELSFLGLDNTAEERASAFVLENVNIALYRTIESGKTAKIFRQRGTAKEYLYEDTNNKVSAPSVIKRLRLSWLDCRRYCSGREKELLLLCTLNMLKHLTRLCLSTCSLLIL